MAAKKPTKENTVYVKIDPEDARPIVASINGEERTFKRGKGYVLERKWREVLENAGYLVSMDDDE